MPCTVFRLPFKIMMLCTVFRLDVCADADCGRSRSGGEHHCHHSLVKVRPTSSSEADVTIQSYFQPGYQQLLQPNFDSYEYNGQVKEISIKFWIMDSKVYFLLFRGSSECSILHSFITVHKKSVLQREYYYLHFHVDYE